jgi:hypothetical protein
MGLTFDHEVLTTAGWTPIGDITEEHNVAVLMKGKSLQYKPVTKVVTKHVSTDVINIVSNELDVETTVDHPLYVAPQIIKADSAGENKLDRIGLYFRNNCLLESDEYDKESINQAIEYIMEHNRVPTEFLLHFNKDQSAFLVGLLFKDSPNVLANTREFANDISIIALNAGLATFVQPEEIVVTEEDIQKNKQDLQNQQDEEKKEEEETKAEELPEPGNYTLVRIIANNTPLITEENIKRSKYDGPIYEIKSLHEDNVLYVRRNGKPQWIYGSTQDEDPDAAEKFLRVLNEIDSKELEPKPLEPIPEVAEPAEA